jgi:hypothetical protein
MALIDDVKKYLGRNPTSAELEKAKNYSSSQIAAYLKSKTDSSLSSETESAADSLVSKASSSANSATVKAGASSATPMLDLLNKYTITDPNADFGVPLTSEEDYKKVNELYDKSVSGLVSSADMMGVANKPFLEGKIPDSVAAQVRQIASEKASSQGVFGNAARSLSARDLGLTSTDLISKGITQQAQISSLRESAAKLSETQREFNKQYDLNVNAFRDQVRQTNLRGLALEEERREFNGKQNLTILGYMVDLVKSQMEVGFNYALNDIDSSGSMDTFDSWLSELRNQLT